jgi:transcriptional regulator with PAS, ATPase and Fis domain
MNTPEIVFASREMESAVEAARKIAATLSPVLIKGESGTGKELIARLIHSAGPRKHRPFVAVNCGAIPETLFESEFFGYRAGAFTGAFRDKPGIFEMANGGSIFLDEIGDLSPAMQAKLLRVLQENELRRIGGTKVCKVDVRVISASNRDLEQQMKKGRFREDLFFRIGVIVICLEPLRRRKEDIALLLDHFADKYARLLKKETPSISSEVLSLFNQYPWPGNVRELENQVHRMVALSGDGGPIRSSEVSKGILACVRRNGWPDPSGRLKERLAVHEKEIIKEALERYGWNKTQTARYLGLTRQGLHRKLQRLRILREE